MAIVYNGTTFSGSNSAQNVNFNGTNMCTVVQCDKPVFSRGEWYATSNGNAVRFNACIYRIDGDGEIYVCWWVGPNTEFKLLHPNFSFNSDVTLSMCLARRVFTYDTRGYIGQPKIVVEGISGECSSCVFVCTLSTSQWNPPTSWSSVDIDNWPSNVCADLGSFSTNYSGTFRFYWPGDTTVGRCWYYHYGSCRACGDSCAQFVLDCLCFTDDDRNGVLRNRCINYGRWTCICA